MIFADYQCNLSKLSEYSGFDDKAISALKNVLCGDRETLCTVPVPMPQKVAPEWCTPVE